MIENLEIRESQPQDLLPIERLYSDAFPDEDLLPLVRDLLSAGPPVLSLVGNLDEELLGHVAFTRCGLVGGSESLSLLAPLAVTPTRQRHGMTPHDTTRSAAWTGPQHQRRSTLDST